MVRVLAYAYIAINFPYLAFYDYVFQTVIQENSKHIDESRVSRKRICLNDHLIASELDFIKTFIHPLPMYFAALKINTPCYSWRKIQQLVIFLEGCNFFLIIEINIFDFFGIIKQEDNAVLLSLYNCRFHFGTFRAVPTERNILFFQDFYFSCNIFLKVDLWNIKLCF